MSEGITGFMCCFCGKDADDPIEIQAHWAEGQWQFFAAHGSCLVERLTPDAQLGPLYEQFGS
jgi:hypothetical protein